MCEEEKSVMEILYICLIGTFFISYQRRRDYFRAKQCLKVITSILSRPLINTE